MTHVLGKAFVAVWLGVSTQLCAATLWSGLQDPPPDQTSGVLVGTGTVLGFHFQPQTDLKLAGFAGYIGYPAALTLVFPPAPGPNFEFSLWEEHTMQGPELPALTGLSLKSALGRTESGLPYWYVACDLSNLPWTLQKDHTYTLTVSPTARCEWLVNGTVEDPFVTSLVGPGANLNALGPSQSWNARLQFEPVPEVNMGIAAGFALVGFAAWRKLRTRTARS